MATPIPALASQVVIDDNTDRVEVAGGSTQTLAQTRYYYLVSNRTTASNGQSLLYAIESLLETSLGGIAWTVKLTSGYKVQITHDNASDQQIVLDSTLATRLGFTASTLPIATGASGLTATYYPRWWWTPDQVVSDTGPERFDHTISYGVPTSAGSAHWSSDQTAAYTDNGLQYRAQYTFSAVEAYYKLRPTSGYTNQDWEGFWSESLRKGRRVLLWRDRDNAVGSNAPSEGASTPYRYVEYQPSTAARESMLATQVDHRNVHFDVTWDFLLTENGETPLTD